VRLLVDECCPRAVTEALRAAGHDVAYVPEFGPGRADDDLARLAEREDRLVVTEDYGFGTLAATQGAPATGVLLVACAGLLPPERAARVAAVVAEYGETLRGHIAVAQAEKVRTRGIRRRPSELGH
jgi:predicted nuclease of predicted toxin-antitoxin system